MKMMIALSLSAGFLLSAAALAQPLPAPVDPDLDHDGKVTLAEFMTTQAARADKIFERLDTDKDGKITDAETAALHPGAPAPKPAAPPVDGKPAPAWSHNAMDTDHDGAVTKVEVAAAAQRRFEAADVNHDGWLSEAERAVMEGRAKPAN